MEALVPYVGVAGSLFSTLLTLYFWFVKARREQPNLRPYLVDREFFLGAQTASQRQIGFKLGIVVANYSELPNALLGVAVAFKQSDGGWLAADQVSFDKQTPMPFNIPSLQTVLLRVNGQLTFAADDSLEQGSGIAGNYVKHHLTLPTQVRVDLRSLNDRVFTGVLTQGGVS